MNHRIFVTLMAAVLPLAACQAPGPHVDLPPGLETAPQETWVGTLSARGVQIYDCRDSGGQPAWTFVAPEAELFDRDGRPAGHHGAGPVWQAADGSAVSGQVRARAEAPAAGAIPWLLLDTHSSGGAGTLQGVKRIRRVNTAGGLAPASGCDAPHLGARLRVPYSADYLLYTSR